MLSIKKYGEMLSAYLDRQSASHVSVYCDVCRATAKKYIEHGDPERGLPPLRQRLVDIQAELQRRENMALAARKQKGK